jgi:small-conductance mechanosensitive channel
VGNFISGILILFEQSLRPNDVLSINGSMAIVDDLNIRSTTVRTLDNVEVIVPNETFLTSAVTNDTKTNRLLRVLLTASYDSNPKEVRKILKKVAQEHPDVQKQPKAEVFLMEFADSSINFQLAVWLDDPTLIKRGR